MHFSTKSLTRAAIIAAAYCALSLVSSALSLAYGPVQLRFSEALCVLPFLMPEAVWGLFVGCLLTNVLSPYGLLDLIFGSAATLLAALLSARCKTRVGAAVPLILCNAVLVGALLSWEVGGTAESFGTLFVYNAATVGAGEAAVCLVLGLPLLRILEKYKIHR